MSVATTVSNINATTLQFAPSVLAGVTAVEAVAKALPGTTKSQIVVNSIIAGAKVGEAVPNPTVAGISALVDLFVSILNATGIFSHSKPKVN